MRKKQMNIRLEENLVVFLEEYSRKNYKTMTAVIREMVVDLYKKHYVSPGVVLVADGYGNALM